MDENLLRALQFVRLLNHYLKVVGPLRDDNARLSPNPPVECWRFYRDYSTKKTYEADLRGSYSVGAYPGNKYNR